MGKVEPIGVCGATDATRKLAAVTVVSFLVCFTSYRRRHRHQNSRRRSRRHHSSRHHSSRYPKSLCRIELDAFFGPQSHGHHSSRHPKSLCWSSRRALVEPRILRGDIYSCGRRGKCVFCQWKCKLAPSLFWKSLQVCDGYISDMACIAKPSDYSRAARACCS